MDHDVVAVAIGQGVQGVPGEIGVVLADVRHADAFEILDGGTEADRFDDRWGTGLKLGGYRRSGETVEPYVGDHVAATDIWRHRIEKFHPAPQDTDPGWADHFVAREHD